MWRRRRSPAGAAAGQACQQQAAPEPTTPGQTSVATPLRSPRVLDWGVRGGGPERAFCVTVHEVDADGLAELVAGTPLEGFLQVRGAPEFSAPEGWSMQSERVGVRDGTLWVTRYHADDETTRTSVTDLLARVARSHLQVLRWRLVENYDGRTWAAGSGNASLGAYLGIEAPVATALER